MFLKGMASVTFRTKSVEEVVGLCKKANLDCIEWGGDVHVPPASARARTAKKLCDDNGIIISSYGSYFLKNITAEYIDEFKRIADTCEILGTDTVRMWAMNCQHSDVSDQTYREFVLKVQTVAEIAENRNLKLCFEHHRNTLSDSGEHTLRLLTDIGYENVKTYWQPICETETENLKSAAALKDLTVNIHVYHWSECRNPERFLLAEGKDCWKNYLSAFNRTNKTYGCLLEFCKNDDEENFLKDAKTLDEIIKEV